VASRGAFISGQALSVASTNCWTGGSGGSNGLLRRLSAFNSSKQLKRTVDGW
jgi:hypothetical protein